jgi:hyperosmotically inducible periplasmic protein
MKRLMGVVMMGALMLAPAFADNTPVLSRKLNGIAEQVRHQLVMLPYYSIFDDFGFQVDGSTVTLYGHVVRPVLKSDAENVVKRIEGVTQVVNKIEVLPLSPFDDRIRLREARAIYSFPSLQRYGLGTQPSIHIIVANGHVTLTGVVNTASDRNVAGIRANGVSGVFSVTNNLQVAN